MGIYSKPELAKKLKGVTAPKILKEFWWLKSWLFRGGGHSRLTKNGRCVDINDVSSKNQICLKYFQRHQDISLLFV